MNTTKNCETLVDQTHRKAEETLELKMTTPKENFRFKPPIQIKGKWMIGLPELEVYNSIFNITEENNKFKLYKFLIRIILIFLIQKSEMRLKEI